VDRSLATAGTTDILRGASDVVDNRRELPHSMIVDIVSTIMEQDYPDITHRLAKRLHTLRTERGLSIEYLAARSGVSRAMISRIERAESSPTAVVLNKLSTGLGVLLPTLFGESSDGAPRERDPVAKRRDQPLWRDPESSYTRRTLTPPSAPPSFQLTEVLFPAGARVSFDNSIGATNIHQQIWLLKGEMEIRLGKQPWRLAAGDCMAMQLDQPISFHNPGKVPARYLVAIADTACKTARRRK
jgi:transcriptional regulator with XRE-family HTH domain